MSCQKLNEPRSFYICFQAQDTTACKLHIALIIIAACGFALSACALIAYTPPSIGYAGAIICILSITALMISNMRCCAPKSLVSSIVNSPPVSEATNSVDYIRRKERAKIDDQPIVLGNYALPNETILLHILKYLIPKELVVIGLTNKLWQTIVYDNVLWNRHCINYLIPSPKNMRVAGSCARQFAKIQKLTAAIIKSELYPKSISFDKPIYSVFIDGDRAFLSFKDGIEIWDANFSKAEQTLISGFSEYRIPDQLRLIGNTLFCLHAPSANRNYDRKGILFAYDLACKKTVIEETPISLYEWEHGESKRRGGRIAFSENKAFCNYKNGDIRVWDFKKQYGREYTDDIEYDDYTEDEHDEDIQYLVKLQEKLIRERQILRGHTGQITHLSAVDDHLYSSSEDGTIKIWNTETEQCIRTIATEISLDDYGWIKQGVDHFTVHGSYLFGYAYSEQKQITYCKLWDLRTGLCLKTLKLNTTIDADAYCLYGNLLFFSQQTTIHAYDLRKGKEIRTFICDIPNDDPYDVPKLTDLQMTNRRLICCAKKRHKDSGKQVFIFDFHSIKKLHM